MTTCSQPTGHDDGITYDHHHYYYYYYHYYYLTSILCFATTTTTTTTTVIQVCLSILGTYHGDPWSPVLKSSSVLLMLESSVLNSHPYFNEVRKKGRICTAAMTLSSFCCGP